MAKMLRTSVFNASFPDGLTIDHPAEALPEIYRLLRNGRNVRLTLDKNDGDKITYELVEEG